MFADWKRITKIGNSHGVILPASFVKWLGSPYLLLYNFFDQFILLVPEDAHTNEPEDFLRAAIDLVAAAEVMIPKEHKAFAQHVLAEVQKLYELLQD